MKYIKAKELAKGLYKVVANDVKYNQEKNYLSVTFKLNQDTGITKYFSCVPDQYSTEEKIKKNMEALYRALGFTWNAAVTNMGDAAITLEALSSKAGDVACLLSCDEFSGNAYVKPYSLKSEGWFLEKFQKTVSEFALKAPDEVSVAKSEFAFDSKEELPF